MLVNLLANPARLGGLLLRPAALLAQCLEPLAEQN